MPKQESEITFANMTVCSAATGISRHRLRRAKAAGCPAFQTSGRVRLRPLVAWIISDRGEDEPDGGALERFRAARAAREELKFRLEDSRAYDASAVDAAIRRAVAKMQRELERRFLAVVPGEAAGMDARAVRRVIEEHLTKWADYAESQAAELTKKATQQ